MSVWVKPSTFWFASFLSWSIPFMIFGQFFFVIYYSFTKKIKKLLIPILVILLGISFINRTFQFWNSKSDEKSNLKILSYNVRVLNVYDHLNNNKPEIGKEMCNWIIGTNSDVICLQEFYNERNSKYFNSIKQLKKGLKAKYYFSASHTNRVGGEFGMIIFSNYPIIGKGVIEQKTKSNNQMLYLDIKVNDKPIRVYNIHLQSMSINENDITDVDSTSKNKIKKVIKRIKKGFIERTQQLALLEEHLELCPYPVIINGDINDLPCSNTYQRLQKKLKNSFEEKGKGFGVTYNGKLPFLRIDNQFFSPELSLNKFTVIDSVKYSDHFPLYAEFNIYHSND